MTGQYLKFEEIKALQVEPTSKCNLLCPQCGRVDKGKINPFLPLTELTPEDYDKIFTDGLVSQLEYVIFNGSYGDPMASRYLNYAVDKLFQKQMNTIRIFTNGSLKNISWWTELGGKFSGTNSEVVFSIDGLEDTNPMYRVNSDFKKIMENASAYIQAGGKARWDFLVFDHNHHQVGEAKALAKKMGFKKFQEKGTKRFIQGDYTHRQNSEKVLNTKGEIINILKPPPKDQKDFEEILKKYGTWLKYINATPVHCKYKHNMKALFIDFEALVWPCCWLGAPSHCVDSENPQKKQLSSLKNKYEKNFNSLRYHSLPDILSHQWFSSDLVQSWENKTIDQNPKLFTCGRTCGTDYEFTSGTKYKNNRMFIF